MECLNCGSEDIFVTQEEGDTLSVCNDCGEVIENGILIQKGREKEKKVYVINCDHDFDFRQAEMLGEYDKIKQKAEELNSVYTLEEFQEAINDEELFLTNSFILIA
jgi:uncharacterized Zn finger protein